MRNIHIKIAWRNIKKNVSYSIINIVGLTVGIACTIFIYLYISDELSFDKYHKKSENIYRVVSHISESDDAFDWIVAQIPFGPQVKKDFPEVLEYVQFIGAGRILFKNDDIKYYDDKVYYTDTSVFKVFTYKFIDGDPITCLKEPNSIVLTESFSQRYFGKENPLGRTIQTSRGDNYKVTGVIKDIPNNSHFVFSALISRTTLPKQLGSWGNFGVYTYLLLPDNYDPNILEKKLPILYETYMAPIFQRIGINVRYSLQPIRNIHLYSKYAGEPTPTGDIWYVKLFIYVAIFMLLIAVINYMNLATARSDFRAKEVALMKVTGSNRKKIIIQFITESFILVSFSLLCSILLVLVLLPNFNALAGKFIHGSILYTPLFIVCLIGLVIVVGFLSGSYPSFYMSRFNPVEVMKGLKLKGTSGAILRKVLVIVQFSISLLMIICTLTVYDQLNFLKNKNTGFVKKNIICIELSAEGTQNKYGILKELFLKNPNVLQVGFTSTPVGEGSPKVIFYMETPEGMVERGINFTTCDHDFVETLGIKIIEGRDFTEDIKSDTLYGVIINETLAKRMNWSDPIGKKVQFGGRQGSEPARVIGLMQDYNQTGLYNEIESLMLIYRLRNNLVYIKLDKNNLSSTIEYIKEQWNSIFPDIPFEYTFLENNINEQLTSDEKRGKLFTLFSVLTIIIACLGLFGLASFITGKKTPEIAVRKVLGVNIGGILLLLSKEFILLICISIFIAFSLGYYIMDNWLQDYAFRTEVRLNTLVFSAIISIIITLISISFHTIKAALANPADSLKEN